MRILIVDDDPQLRAVLQRMLCHLGFGRSDEAEDGEAALGKLASGPYDAVLTDWQMPRMDGLRLLRCIRSSPTLGRLPVVIATGDLTFERVRDACAAGVTGLLVKPFTTLALERQLSKVTEAEAGFAHVDEVSG